MNSTKRVPDHQDPPIVYGDILKTTHQTKAWGKIGTLFSDWGELDLNGYILEVTKEVSYEEWGDVNSENLCIVEKGSGTLVFNGENHQVSSDHVFKVFPGQNVIIKPDEPMQIFSVQMPGSAEKAEKGGEDLDKLQVIDTQSVSSMVYEYEALGQEIIMCDYKPGLGMIKFTFPIERIPIHKHPIADRLIRPAQDSDDGFTFAGTTKHPMNSSTFALFPKGTVHTNGPKPGGVYKVYAFQLPSVDPKIDHENIAGAEDFVEYIASTPPKELWKKKEDFERAMKKLQNKN